LIEASQLREYFREKRRKLLFKERKASTLLLMKTLEVL